MEEIYRQSRQGILLDHTEKLVVKLFWCLRTVQLIMRNGLYKMLDRQSPTLC